MGIACVIKLGQVDGVDLVNRMGVVISGNFNVLVGEFSTHKRLRELFIPGSSMRARFVGWVDKCWAIVASWLHVSVALHSHGFDEGIEERGC